jgi:hypothetical protein
MIVRNIPSEKIINGNRIVTSDMVVASVPEYRTAGEGVVVIKNIPTCKVLLDHLTTDRIVIKAQTNVLIIPSIGRIDDEYDEIMLERGACVEFAHIVDGWYILSSDGLKGLD